MDICYVPSYETLCTYLLHGIDDLKTGLNYLSLNNAYILAVLDRNSRLEVEKNISNGANIY